MNKVDEISDLILEISENPETLDDRFEQLVKLIRRSKGDIKSDILSDKDLTKIVINVSEGSGDKDLKSYLVESFKALKKSFSEVESESTFGLVVQDDPRNNVTDNERIILMSSPTRDIYVNNTTGYIVDKDGNKFTVKVYNTEGNAGDINQWKFVRKQLATKESLANLIK